MVWNIKGKKLYKKMRAIARRGKIVNMVWFWSKAEYTKLH